MTSALRPPPGFSSFARMVDHHTINSDGLDAAVGRAAHGIDREHMPGFIDFVQMIIDGGASNRQLEELWSRAPSEFFTSGATVRQMLIHAKTVLESRGGRGRKAWMPRS